MDPELQAEEPSPELGGSHDNVKVQGLGFRVEGLGFSEAYKYPSC